MWGFFKEQIGMWLGKGPGALHCSWLEVTKGLSQEASRESALDWRLGKWQNGF